MIRVCIFALTFLVGLKADSIQPKYSTCSSITPLHINIEDLIQFSPFQAFQTNNKSYECSKFVYVGPEDDSYTATVILLQGSSTFSIDVHFVDNIIAYKYCNIKKVGSDYKAIYYKINSKSKASFCLANCDSDGKGYKDLICVGKNQDDYDDIHKFLTEYLPEDQLRAVFNAQTNCIKPPYCHFFVN